MIILSNTVVDFATDCGSSTADECVTLGDCPESPMSECDDD